MGLLGFNTEAVCFGDKGCIAQRDAKIAEQNANANALNALASNSGKGKYTTIIIVVIISIVAIGIVASVIYLKTKNKL